MMVSNRKLAGFDLSCNNALLCMFECVESCDAVSLSGKRDESNALSFELS